MLDTLSPFPHRRVSSRASASAASSADDVLPSSSLATTPRDPLPIAMISRDEWVHPFDLADNDLSRGPMLLAVFALTATLLGVLGLLVLAFALALGAI